MLSSRLVIVPVDSSAARMPLPAAMMACAVSIKTCSCIASLPPGLAMTPISIITEFQDVGYSRQYYLAEGVGFEPTRGSHPCRFSRPVHSTALPPLRLFHSRLVPVVAADIVA